MTPDEFWAKVDRSGGPDACWPWTGRPDRNGYGMYWFDHKDRLAHRGAWMSTNGPIPDGMKVLHRCDNPSCCNTAHLFLGTQLDNIRDRNAKGRQARGSRVHTARLTEAGIPEIRRRLAAGESQSAVARAYGVRHCVIWNIAHGRTWKCVPHA